MAKKNNKDETLSLSDEVLILREQPSPLRIGPYKIIKKLGEGGFGEVFLADQEEPVRRRVAIKILQSRQDSENVVSRFRAEQQALAMMNHENIARIFDAGITEYGLPYFVMEYVEGAHIKNYCDQEKLTVKDRLHLFIKVCDGVHHAHQKGIIHRDLKPGNVIVARQDGKPVPKIIDFGIAKAMGEDLIEESVKTQIGFVIGTPAYMSPEQMFGSRGILDTRSDIYSMGVILYELLVDSRPFDMDEIRGEVQSRLMSTMQERTPHKPSDRLAESGQTKPMVAENRKANATTLVRQIRGDLDWIVLKALEKSPDRRYASASEFAADINRHLEHQPVLAGPPSTVYRLKKFIRRHRRGVMVAAVAAAGLVAGIAGLSIGLLEAVKARDLASMEKNRAQAEADKAKAVNTILQNMIASPDPGVVDRNVRVLDILERLDGIARRDLADQPEIEAEVQHTLARSFDAVGSPREALAHIERTVALRFKVMGEDHPETLRAQNTKANILLRLGRLKEAETIHSRTLEARKRVLGPEHPDTLSSMNNLAIAYRDQGRYVESAKLLDDTLKLRKLVLGADHIDTSRTMSTLASSLRNLGEYKEAEQLSRSSLERLRNIAESTRISHGENHPDVLYALSQVAFAFYSLEQYQEAEEIFRRLIDGRTRVLGPDHLSTLWSQKNLADALLKQRKWSESEKTYRSVWHKLIDVAGENHPNALGAAAGLADVLHEQQKDVEAEKIYRDVIKKMRNSLGIDHPATLEYIANYGSILRNRRKYRDAEELFRGTWEEMKKREGDNHRDTLSSAYNLAGIIRDQGRFEEAEELFRETMNRQEKVLGPDHSDTLASMNALAVTLSRLGDFEKAESLLLANIESRKRAFGAEHRNTIIAMSNLAGVWSDRGDYEKAEILIREVIQIMGNVFGESHPNTLITRANLGEALNHQGKYQESEIQLRDVIEKMRGRLPKNHPAYIFCLQTLAVTLEGQGKREEGDQIRREIKKITYK